jgi:alkanesulfonate monooxygenase SsuD/methylene tetrahydromethanopterin reductase-like flavin-dependent oxidoreductase (luciferase family)
MVPLHIGLIAPNFGPELSPDVLRETAVAAEEVGFDSVWTTDHIAVPDEMASVYGHISEALVTLGYLAGITNRLRLGVSALIVPPREPLLLLKQVLSVDLLSAGRGILCVAPGWTEREFKNLGHSLRQRGRRLEGWLQLVDLIQSSPAGPIDFEAADLASIHDAWISPRPARRLEVWVAGNSEHAVRRASRYDAWHPVGRPLSEIRERIELLRSLNARTKAVLRLKVTFQDSASEVDERGQTAVGGPAQLIVERLNHFLEAGCTGFLVDLDHDKPGLAERVHRFAEEVRPHLKIGSLLTHPWVPAKLGAIS